jgi:uncharacterized lipoprotein YbaY
MSPRDTFWFLAGALVTVAIVVTARAWFRDRPAQTARAAIPSFAIPIAAALALTGVAIGIYFLLGSPNSIASDHNAPTRVATGGQARQPTQSSDNAGSLDEVTRKLAARLAANGGTDDEWKLLAQSYEYMGRTAEAKAAESHIASVTSAEGKREGQSDAESPLSGSQMAEIANALDASAATGGGTTSQSKTVQISGTVDIASKLAPQAQSGATLFIYAKQPDSPGPPLAVLRVRADHWPVTFTLSDDDAMVPGRNLSNANSVQVEARISRDGNALPHSGDLVGSVTSVNPRDGHTVKISIDRQIG